MELNYRGYYVYEEASCYQIIQFFPSGKVVGASVLKQSPIRETLASVKNWLGYAYSKNYGYWQQDGNKVSFSLTSASGSVDYKATIVSDTKLKVDSHSNINGFNAYDRDYILYTV